MPHADERRERMLREALDHLRSAVDLLDHAEAPSEIGAWADTAINQLADLLYAEERMVAVPSALESADQRS